MKPTLRSALALFALALACKGTSPPGDLKKYRPVDALPKVAAYAGKDAQLLRLDADYVLSDGTMDLTASYRPRVAYSFRIRATAKDIENLPPAPPGANPKEGDWLSAYVTVKNSAYLCNGKGCATYGMERSISLPGSYGTHPMESPCDPAALWKIAIEKGAAADAAAKIRYDAQGADFVIERPSFKMRFDAACAPMQKK